MSHAAMADAIGLIHAAFVSFVVGGLILILAGWRRGWHWTRGLTFRLTHLLAITVVVLQTWLGQLCPLTILENRLRALARQEGVGESFIAHWLERFLYWRLPSWVFLAVYTAFALLVVAAFVWYPPRRKKNRLTAPRKNADVLRELLPLKSRRVVDIGCGDGALVRLMTREGAQVTGIDTNPAQIAKARATEAAGDETYVMAPGEKLPFPDGAFGSAVIFNALHHIPPPAMAAALTEVARVLNPGGLLYVSEPLAQGSNFELTQPVDDEAEVRAQAYEALRAAIAKGIFREERELTYTHAVLTESFEAFVAGMVRVDPARAPAIARHDAELRRRFARLGRDTPKGRAFDQPMRVNLLIKS